jgi:hypothetical protein
MLISRITAITQDAKSCNNLKCNNASNAVLALARRAWPDWEFRLAPEPDGQPAELMLGLEVLI